MRYLGATVRTRYRAGLPAFTHRRRRAKAERAQHEPPSTQTLHHPTSHEFQSLLGRLKDAKRPIQTVAIGSLIGLPLFRFDGRDGEFGDGEGSFLWENTLLLKTVVFQAPEVWIVHDRMPKSHAKRLTKAQTECALLRYVVSLREILLLTKSWGGNM